MRTQSARSSDSRPDSATGELTRQRLLQAAFEVFAQRGFDGGTVREITDRAGANLAAVSYHFRGKEELYVAVIAQAVLRLLGPLEREWQRVRTLEQRRDACLTVLRETLFDAHGAAPAVLLIARELASGSRALRHVLRLALADEGVLGRMLTPWHRADEAHTTATVATVLGAMTAAACLAPPLREPMREEAVAAVHRDRETAVQHLATMVLSANGV